MYIYIYLYIHIYVDTYVHIYIYVHRSLSLSLCLSDVQDFHGQELCWRFLSLGTCMIIMGWIGAASLADPRKLPHPQWAPRSSEILMGLRGSPEQGAPIKPTCRLIPYPFLGYPIQAFFLTTSKTTAPPIPALSSSVLALNKGFLSHGSISCKIPHPIIISTLNRNA